MYNMFVSLVPNVWLSTTFHSRMSHATAQRVFWFLVCWVSFLYPSTECGLFALYTLNIFLHVSNTRAGLRTLTGLCLSQGLCYQGHCKRQDCHCTQWNHTGMQDIWLSSGYKCLYKTLCPPPFPLLLFSVLLYFLTISSFIHPLSSFPPLPSPPSHSSATSLPSYPVHVLLLPTVSQSGSSVYADATVLLLRNGQRTDQITSQALLQLQTVKELLSSTWVKEVFLWLNLWLCSPEGR